MRVLLLVGALLAGVTGAAAAIIGGTNAWNGTPPACACAQSGCHPQFQPGTANVLFNWPAFMSHIVVAVPGGVKTYLTTLTSPASTDVAAEYNLAGTSVVFQRSNTSIGYAAMTMNSDGSGLTNVTAGTPANGAALLPTYDPSGRIVFTGVQGQTPQGVPEGPIFRVNADGTGFTTIVSPGSPYVSLVAVHVSPDGTQITYGCGPDSHGNGLQVCVCSYPTCATQTQLTTPAGAEICADPHWSPDSTKIIYECDNGTDMNIYTMNRDGSSQTKITSFVAPQEAQDASYSPDGTQIAFEWDNGYSARPPGTESQVWMMNADGSNQHVMTCAQ